MKSSNFGLLVIGACLFSNGCDKTVVNEAAGNGEVSFDETANKEVAGQDITLNRVRVVKAAANTGAPGVASVRDYFYVDIWATLSGEKKSRLAKMGPFVADADGNLYQEDAEPGSLAYNTTLAAAAGTDISYEVTAKDGLIATEWDVVVESQTNLSESGARTTVKRNLLKISEQNTVFKDTIRSRTYSAGAAFNRTRYQDNSDFALKGKVGCFNKTTSAALDTSFDSIPIWYDVELGSTVSDKDGTVSSTKASTDDGNAGDQILWVKWLENWYVTGLNVNTKTLRMVRERSAPFYFNRELPKRVITTAAGGTPSPSGVEKMIRACSNAVEVTTGAKVFYLAGLLGSTSSTTYSGFDRNIGQAAGTAHCAATKTVADTVALTTSYSAGTTVFATCAGLTGSTIGLTIQGGTWDGTKSAGTVSTVSAGAVSGGTLLHIDHTAIVDIAY